MKRSLQFQAYQTLKSTGAALVTILLMCILLPIAFHYSELNSISFSGYEFCCLIVAFVLGCLGINEGLRVLVQYGGTRRSFFLGRMLVGILFACSIALISVVCDCISSFFSSLFLIEDNYSLTQYFEHTSLGRFGYLALLSAIGFVLFMLGHLCACIHARFSRFVKAAISLAVLCVFVLLLRALFQPYQDGLLVGAVLKATGKHLSLWVTYPLLGVAELFALGSVLWLFSWLPLRRTAITGK